MKLINFILKLTTKIKEAIDKYASFINDFIYKNKKISNKVSDSFYLLINHLIKLVYFIVNFYSDQVMKLYTIARWSTIPTNKLWIIGWFRYILSQSERDPFDEGGNQYINAPVGGGKSSIMFAKMKDFAKRSGKASYVTTAMEKPKYKNMERYVYHRVFNLQEFFSEGKQIRNFDTDHFDTIIVDELHLLNNNRKNKEKAYNDIFLPLVNNSILMRHKGIKTILFASQMLKNDIQLMSLLKYYHKVKAVKGIDYRQWLIDGKFKITIIGWKVQTYTIEMTDNGFKLHKHKFWFKKNYPAYLRDFETLAMKDINNDLPKDNIFKRNKRR